MLEIEIEPTRVCPRCRQEKPLSEFHKLKSSKDGHGRLCKLCHCQSSRDWLMHHPNQQKEWYRSHREQDSQRGKEWKLRLKVEVLTVYGNGKCACVQCGFSDLRALSIDHINGKGRQHAESIRRSGTSTLYFWLKKNNYPLGYQTLCMNCQFIKAIRMA